MKLAKFALPPPIVALTALFAFVVTAEAETLVKTLRADGTGDCATLAEAVAAMDALTEGQAGVIVLEPGDYPVSEPVTLAKAVTIRSASGNPSDVTIKAAKTLMCRVLFLDHPEAGLIGVTVRDGYATGKEQNYSAANVTLLQGAVSNCWITSGTLGAVGQNLCNCAAGIYVEKGRVSDCRIFDNIGKQGTYDCAAIGLCLADGTALVERCEISGNTNMATEYGMAGGARILSGTLTDSFITNNISFGHAGGVYIDNGFLVNSLVAFNLGCCQSTGRRGGGVHAAASSQSGQWAVISNCTIACNNAYQDGGVYVGGNTDRTKFFNTIVWGNGEVSVGYTTGWPNIQNAYAQSVKNCWFGYTANKLESRADDPCFVDPWHGDFRLQACSPCVGMGYLPDARTGAFVTISAPDAQPYAIGDITFVGELHGFDEEATFSYRVDDLLSGAEGAWQAGSASNTITVNEAGKYRFVLKATADGVDTSAAYDFRVGPTDVYVAKDGTATEPFDEEGKATSDILAALAYCADGTTLHIGEGDFPAAREVAVVRKVAIKGAGPDKSSVYTPGPYYDGGATYVGTPRRVMRLENAAATVEGLAVTNGDSLVGCDIALRGSTVSNCLFGCSGQSGTGGTSTFIHSGKVVDSVITGCKAKDGRNFGFGVCLNTADAQLIGSTICDNSCASGYYSGSPARAAAGRIDRCVFTRNSMASNRGGALMMAGGVTVENSLFYGNTNTYNGAGAITVHANGFTVRNCTFVKNRGPKTGGIHFSTNDNDGSFKGLMVNNLFWDNFGGSAGAAEHDYVKPGVNVVWSNNSVSVEGAVRGTGGIYGDPVFTNPSAGDFTLQTKSACRNAGDNYEGMAELDLAGGQRIREDIVDIGCYEYVPSEALSVTYKAEIPTDPAGTPVFTASATGGDLDGVQYRWRLTDEVSGQTADWTEWSGVDTFSPPSASGRYSLVVEVRNHEGADGCETATFNDDGKSYIHPEAELYLVSPETEGHVACEPYNTPATAATNFEEVVRYFGDGTVLTVGPGEYPTAALVATLRRVTIKGSDPKTTRIFSKKGSEAHAILTLSDPRAVIAGVTLADGAVAASGEGACLFLNGGTASNCCFTGSSGPAVTSKGGKIYDCDFVKNTSSSYTVSNLDQSGDDAVCVNCRFINASSAGYYSHGNIRISGGVFSHAVVTNNLMLAKPGRDDRNAPPGSYGTSCGGLRVEGRCAIDNCLIARNVCNDDSAGIAVFRGPASVTHCTIVSNLCSGVRKGAGILVRQGEQVPLGDCTLFVTNCIVYGNRAVYAPEGWHSFGAAGNWKSAELVNTLVEDTDGAALVENCFFADPLFRNAAKGDYRVRQSSPCTFAGVTLPVEPGQADLRGRPRRTIQPAIGCYESGYGAMIIVR